MDGPVLGINDFALLIKEGKDKNLKKILKRRKYFDFK